MTSGTHFLVSGFCGDTPDKKQCKGHICFASWFEGTVHHGRVGMAQGQLITVNTCLHLGGSGSNIKLQTVRSCDLKLKLHLC